MQALEFSTVLNQNLQIDIPHHYLNLLSNRSKLRVIILVEDDEIDETVWKATTAQQFFQGYSDEDSIYDNL